MDGLEKCSRFLLVLADGELSLAEIVTYLKDRGVNCHLITRSADVALLSTHGFELMDAMLDWGGVFKLGSVLGIVEKHEITSEKKLTDTLNRIRFYDWLGEKVKWGISVYHERWRVQPQTYNFFVRYFQSRLRREGASKAKYVSPSGEDGSMEIISDDAIRHKLSEGGIEILIVNIGDRFYLGKTLAIIDQKGYKHRDFDRPSQEPKISMPPRLARVLVNLSGAKRGLILLDPFCGVGTILQEALMMGIDIRGVDVERRRVKQTIANLHWLGKEYRLPTDHLEEKVSLGDATKLSSHFDRRTVDAIASEPILIPPLRRTPTIGQAKKMLAKSSTTYRQALNEMVYVLKDEGRIAVTVPYVKTCEGVTLTIPFSEMLRSLKLRLFVSSQEKLSSYPLFASTKGDERVVRGVYVLKKS